MVVNVPISINPATEDLKNFKFDTLTSGTTTVSNDAKGIKIQLNDAKGGSIDIGWYYPTGVKTADASAEEFARLTPEFDNSTTKTATVTTVTEGAITQKISSVSVVNGLIDNSGVVNSKIATSLQALSGTKHNALFDNSTITTDVKNSLPPQPLGLIQPNGTSVTATPTPPVTSRIKETVSNGTITDSSYYYYKFDANELIANTTAWTSSGGDFALNINDMVGNKIATDFTAFTPANADMFSFSHA